MLPTLDNVQDFLLEPFPSDPEVLAIWGIDEEEEKDWVAELLAQDMP
jgi:hypothetical protein